MKRDTEFSCQVLLSTYNGMEYLPEQLRSIETQRYRNVDILIRDDGSHDGTLEYVRDYAFGREDVEVIAGDNVGVVDSFMRLLDSARDRDAYAFCDQDDVWLPNKIERAAQRLEPSRNEPMLYFSRQEYVDENERTLGYSDLPRFVGLRNALVQNIAIGCTTVINEATRRLLVAHTPTQAIMHDWWAYLLVSALGRVVYDPAVTMKYRQHGGNTLGATASTVERLRRRSRRFLTRNWKSDVFRPRDQAEEFLRQFGDRLREADRQIVARFVHSKSSVLRRWAYALSTVTRRNRLSDDIILRLMILLNRY